MIQKQANEIRRVLGQVLDFNIKVRTKNVTAKFGFLFAKLNISFSLEIVLKKLNKD